MRNHILILHNPRSGSRHAVDVVQAITAEIQNKGYVVVDHSSLDQFAADVTRLTASGELRAVISAGGDGTASAVVARIDRETPVWLCPLGTENLLARHLGMTADPKLTAASIDQLQTRRFDAGLANGKLFLILTGVGYDAEVVRCVHNNRRGHIRRWHYWWPILKCALTYSFPQLRLTVLGHPSSLTAKGGGEMVVDQEISMRQPSDSSIDHQKTWEAAWFFLINQPRYADGLSIAPDANGEDGMLDVCSFRNGGIWQSLQYLIALRRGRHHELSDFYSQKLTHFRIDVSPNGGSRNSPVQVSYQIDGDWGGYLPLKVESLPGRLCTVVPYC